MNEKIEETIQKIRPVDLQLMEKAQEKLDNLTKPQDVKYHLLG